MVHSIAPYYNNILPQKSIVLHIIAMGNNNSITTVVSVNVDSPKINSTEGIASLVCSRTSTKCAVSVFHIYWKTISSDS